MKAKAASPTSWGMAVGNLSASRKSPKRRGREASQRMRVTVDEVVNALNEVNRYAGDHVFRILAKRLFIDPKLEHPGLASAGQAMSVEEVLLATRLRIEIDMVIGAMFGRYLINDAIRQSLIESAISGSNRKIRRRTPVNKASEAFKKFASDNPGLSAQECRDRMLSDGVLTLDGDDYFLTDTDHKLPISIDSMASRARKK